MFRWILLLAVLLTASCDIEKLVGRDLELARHSFSLLQSRDFTALEAKFDPSLRSAGLRAKLEQAADQIPAGAPLNETRYVSVSTVNGHTTVRINLRYQFSEGWRRFNYEAEGEGEARAITSLSVEAIAPPDPPPSLSEMLLDPFFLIALVIWIGGFVGAVIVIHRLFIRHRRR